MHSDSRQTERQQKQPHDRVGDDCKQSQRPVQDQEEAPEEKLCHTLPKHSRKVRAANRRPSPEESIRSSSVYTVLTRHLFR